MRIFAAMKFQKIILTHIEWFVFNLVLKTFIIFYTALFNYSLNLGFIHDCKVVIK